jgi:sugar phosphate isomerase/epimerase
MSQFSRTHEAPTVGRREFLGAGALALAALAGHRAVAAHHTAEHGADGKARLPGIQLYTVRGSMEQDVPATLAAVAAIGYKEVECAGYFNIPPEKFRGMIEDLGMRSPNSHVDWAKMRDDPRSVIEPAAAIGNQWATIAWLPEEERRPLDKWKAWAETLNKAGEIAKTFDMRVAYHNHEFEFQPTDGRVPYDILLAETNPELVDFELDFFWVRNAGKDIGEVLNRAPGRFVMAHIKDMNAAGDMVDVGAGEIDFVSLLASPAGSRIHHLFVEHDTPQDAFRTAAISYRALDGYLAKLNG